MFTTIKKLYHSPDRKTSKFFLHKGMYINDILKDGNEFVVTYANGNMTRVSGDSKVQILETK